jgi:hypothetical protein
LAQLLFTPLYRLKQDIQMRYSVYLEVHKMNYFLEAINHPIEAFKNKSKAVSWSFVALTVLINTVFEPILAWTAGTFHPIPDLYRMLTTTLLGCVSYLVLCTVFWIICKAFGSETPLKTYIDVWGLTFFPTLLCSIAVAFSETFFTVFWNNSIWGMLLSIVFVGILIWKTILYVLFLKEIAGLKGIRLFLAFAAIGILIVFLAMLNGYMGLKTPIL